MEFSIKIISKNELKCFKLKKLNEILPKQLKIKNVLTPKNIAREIGPNYIIFIEKELKILLKTTKKIKLALYQFPYKIFKQDFSDLPYANFNFSKPMIETYNHTNDLIYLKRGVYFLRVENFLNNKLYENLEGIFDILWFNK